MGADGGRPVASQAVGRTAAGDGGEALPAARHPLRRFALRGLTTQAACVVIALLYVLIDRRGSPFGTTWLHSTAIGTCCWLCIDAARWALGTLAGRRRGAGAGPGAGPGAGADAGPAQGLSWLAACIAVGTPVGFVVGSRLANALLGQPSPPLASQGPALVVSLLAAVALTLYARNRERLHQARMTAESARRIAAEHELRLLESQLEPHMLFNTLANLRVLIVLDAPRAQAMLDRLVAFLRATLGASRVSGTHPLADEFARLADYLALMQVRLGPRLAASFSLPDDLRGVPVPPFVLQPLVENAIRHGLEPQVAGGRIEIAAARDGAVLVLRVRDTGAGPSSPAGNPGDAAHAGFGLTQVRERLASLYGAAAGLTLEATGDAEGGMLATVRLPLPAGTA